MTGTLRFSQYNVVSSLDGHVGLFAGLSGALEVMTADQWSNVQAFVAGSDDGSNIADLLERLVRMRAVCSTNHDELAELRNRYNDARWRSDTLGYTVVTSLGCNFDCPYCFESKHPSLLKPAVADAMVDILQDSIDSINRLNVTWMGGEPLLGRKQLFDLSRRFIEVCDANEKAYSATIITNGWYLDAQTAAELKACRVRSAQVTIDGPPDVHNRNRPLRNGGPTFDRILQNVCEASAHIDIAVRVNLDATNAHRAEELLMLLADAGLAGKVQVGLGKITDAVSDATAPLATYNTGACLSHKSFSEFELAFTALAEHHGFGYPGPPSAIGAPCTAVRSREIVVGSDGEMWKCWDDIGNADEAIGTISDYTVTNNKLDKWLEYHPADDPQCSTCIAMPVCMGGCVHHDFHSNDREARCGTFRHNHVERTTELLRRAANLSPGVLPELPMVVPGGYVHATPVTLGRKGRAAERSTPTAV